MVVVVVVVDCDECQGCAMCGWPPWLCFVDTVSAWTGCERKVEADHVMDTKSAPRYVRMRMGPRPLGPFEASLSRPQLILGHLHLAYTHTMSTTVFLGIPRVSVGLFDRAATSSRHIQPLLRQGPLLGRARSTVAFRPETSALVAQSRKSRHTILPSQSLSLRLLGTRNFTSSTPRANSTKGSPAAPQEKKEVGTTPTAIESF